MSAGGAALSARWPIDLDVYNSLRRGVDTPYKPMRESPSSVVMRTILQRDFHRCRFCGLRSKKYHQPLLCGPWRRDLEEIYPACIFCHQCFHLETVGTARSGVLISLPEIPQWRLNELMRQVYVGRISSGPLQGAARKVLDELLARKFGAEAQLGFHEPERLATRLIETPEKWRTKLEPIRLLPLDRRIIKEADLEFNQFPQILAYWRSKDGPYSRGRTIDSHGQMSLLSRVAEDGLAVLFEG